MMQGCDYLTRRLLSKPAFYDMEGEPITIEEYCKILMNDDDRVIAQTSTHDLLISTVWLGLDHGIFQEKPLIFETMIFDSANNGEGIYQTRYATKEEAKLGHNYALQNLHQIVKEYYDDRDRPEAADS